MADIELASREVPVFDQLVLESALYVFGLRHPEVELGFRVEELEGGLVGEDLAFEKGRADYLPEGFQVVVRFEAVGGL